MDIDVVEGKDVVPTGVADVRGSEIDVKVPERQTVAMSELFPDVDIESEQMPALEPPPAQQPQQQVMTYYRVRLGDEDNPDDLHSVLQSDPDVTMLIFDYNHNYEEDENREKRYFKYLQLIPKFKYLQSIEIENCKTYDAKLSKLFLKSPTCTELIFSDCELWHHDSFFKAVAKSKILQSLQFFRCYIPHNIFELVLRSISIMKIKIIIKSLHDPIDILKILPLILANKSLLELNIDPRIIERRGTPLNQAMQRQWQQEDERILEAWRQIDAHLLENRQRRMVFPVLAAMQLTGSRDKLAIVDLLPTISRLLGDPPITRQRAVEMVNQIEPPIQLGKRKEIESKPLPFMF